MYRLLNLVDGGSLAALAAKGNLAYAESLYNPGNFFAEVHHFVFDEADLAVKLDNPTIHVHHLKGLTFPPKLRVVMSLVWRIVQLIGFIRNHRIDVIRSRGTYQAGLLAVVVAKITGRPVVVSIGGDSRLSQELEGRHYFGSKRISHLVEEFVLRRADRVICPNRFSREYVIRLGVAPGRAVVVPLMLTPRVWEQRGRGFDVEAGWWDAPMLTVLYVGRLTAYKQVDVLVEAIPLVVEQGMGVRFIFVGAGPLQAQLSRRCEELGVAGLVKFVGAQPTERVVDYMQAASVVWVPMSGFVMFEAAAASKAIVAFDVEWHSEFVSGGAGILVENRNVERLAEATVRLLRSPKVCELVGKNARAKLERVYDPASILRKEIEVYESVGCEG